MEYNRGRRVIVTPFRPLSAITVCSVVVDTVELVKIKFFLLTNDGEFLESVRRRAMSLKREGKRNLDIEEKQNAENKNVLISNEMKTTKRGETRDK